MELSFGAIGEGLHVEVAGAVEPFLVLPQGPEPADGPQGPEPAASPEPAEWAAGLGGEGAEEAQAALVVGEDAHDEGTAFEFLVEAFEEVGAFEVFVISSAGSGRR